MALGENQERMTEVEAYQVYQLNYVRILLLGDAGEAIIASFFTKILRLVRMTGKDPGKLQLQNIPSPMILSSTQLGVEDLLIAAMIFLKEAVEGVNPAGIPIMVLLIHLVGGLQMMALEKEIMTEGINTHLQRDVLSVKPAEQPIFPANFLMQVIVGMENIAGFLMMMRHLRVLTKDHEMVGGHQAKTQMTWTNHGMVQNGVRVILQMQQS